MPGRLHNSAEPEVKVIEEEIDFGEDDEDDKCGEGEATDDGARHGVVWRTATADLDGGEAEGDEAEDGCSGSH